MNAKDLILAGAFGGKGGSGGVTSWNDLPDRPFGEGENVVLLPATQFQPSGDIGAFVAQADFKFVAGKTYVINWNGVEYTCTAQHFGYQTTVMVGVGNPVVAGGENNGLPFVLAIDLYYNSMDGIIAAIPLDGSESVTVSIKGPTVTPIPERFVTPDVLVLDYAIGNIVNYKPEFGNIYATKEQIFEAYMYGKRIVAYLPSSVIGHDVQFNLYEVISVNRDASIVLLHTNCKVEAYQYEYYALTYSGYGVYTVGAKE